MAALLLFVLVCAGVGAAEELIAHARAPNQCTSASSSFESSNARSTCIQSSSLLQSKTKLHVANTATQNSEQVKGECSATCASLDEAAGKQEAKKDEPLPVRASLKIRKVVLATEDDDSISQLYNIAAADEKKCMYFEAKDKCGYTEKCHVANKVHEGCNGAHVKREQGSGGETILHSTMHVPTNSDVTDQCLGSNSCLAGMLQTTSYYVCDGDRVEYSFKAEGGGDWYECGIVLYKGTPGSGEIVNSRFHRGNKLVSYVSDDFTVSEAGDYYLGFFSASYDKTNGGYLGAKMYIKSFEAVGTCTATYAKKQDEGKCESFCAEAFKCDCEKTWTEKCEINDCSGCQECLRPPPTPPPTPTPTPPPTPNWDKIYMDCEEQCTEGSMGCVDECLKGHGTPPDDFGSEFFFPEIAG